MDGRRKNAAKLTEEQVAEIRELLREADELKDRLALLTYKHLGEMYGVYPQTIWAIKHRGTWKNVD